MIGFNALGNYGHIGNQMFQYAAVKGIATYHGYDWCIPSRENFGKYYPMRSSIHDAFNIICNEGMIDGETLEENQFKFDEEFFKNCPNNINLLGYFQTEKYFKHIEEDVKKDFSFDSKVIEECLGHIKTLGDEVISLHIRRGDYLNLQSYHPNIPLEHYEVALSKLPNVPVLIFSDDPEWCLSKELFTSDRFNISFTENPVHDMCLMTLCNYHIISNSSFSWWGAWLSNSKHVIAPKIWFGPSLPNHDTSDLYLNNWEVL